MWCVQSRQRPKSEGQLRGPGSGLSRASPVCKSRVSQSLAGVRAACNEVRMALEGQTK